MRCVLCARNEATLHLTFEGDIGGQEYDDVVPACESCAESWLGAPAPVSTEGETQ